MEAEKAEEANETEEEEAAEEPNDSNEVVEQEEDNTTIEKNEGDDEDKHQEQVDLAYEIFDAQEKQDYDFLESVLSQGSTLDKKTNMFSFENVTYPHEQEFLTAEDIGELEFRYTHKEDEDSIIVGFGAINYETESSFVIDFEFVNENGTWKMNDMDINK